MYGSVGRNRLGKGPVKNSAYPQPLISLAFNDLGNGAVDTAIGNQALLAAPTFTRATVAACRLANGNWNLAVGNNTPRSHYHLLADGTLVYGGYLFEAASTQLLTSARDLSNAAWVKTNINITFANGMDGGVNNCSVLTSSLANGTCLQAFVTAAAQRTFSAWVKRRVGAGIIEITQDGGTTWTDITTQIDANNFRQVQVTGNTLNPSIGFRIQTNGDSITVDCTQYEAGDCATTPIGGGARNSDILTYPFTPVVQGVGTIYAELSSASIINPPSFKVETVQIDNSAANNVQLRVIPTSRDVDGTVNNVGVQADFVGLAGTANANFVYQSALAYNLNDMGFCTKGIVTEQDSVGTPPTDINRISMGVVSANASGCVKNFRYWPTRLLNSQLQVLTN